MFKKTGNKANKFSAILPIADPVQVLSIAVNGKTPN